MRIAQIKFVIDNIEYGILDDGFRKGPVFFSHENNVKPKELRQIDGHLFEASVVKDPTYFFFRENIVFWTPVDNSYLKNKEERILFLNKIINYFFGNIHEHKQI